MRGANSNPLETISAAATAIASAGNRVPQASVQVSNLIRILSYLKSDSMDIRSGYFVFVVVC